MTHLLERLVQEDKGGHLVLYAFLTGGVSIFVFPEILVVALRQAAWLFDIVRGGFISFW